MIRFLAFWCSVFALASAASAAPQPIREPTSKWLVEYAKDQCLLSRNFGSDDSPLFLTFERLPMTSEVTIHILKKGSRESGFQHGQALIAAGDETLSEERYFASTIAARRLRLINTRLASDKIAAIARREVLRIRAAGEIDERFAVPRLTAALEALNDCTIDLGRAWGVSVEQQKALKQGVEPLDSLAKVFSPNDYPALAQRNGDDGRAKILLSVDASSKPTNCVLTRSAGVRDLDETSCRILMKKARFRPAIGHDGKPMPSLYVTSVTWLLM